MARAGDRMTRLGQLLDECLLLELQERRAWLDGLAGEDRQLVRGLRESLLAEDPASRIHGPLDQPPSMDGLVVGSMCQPARQAGERFGAYELLRPLGTGGMAEVWLACRADGAFERLVALKIPRLREMPSQTAGRFARECRILASLEYPGIARLYDAGIDSAGVPYIAMEYVRGAPLVEWCNTRGLDAAARIRLFMQVLDAVNYAHQRHVLHRDLKPSNIFVTEGGEVRLLDFGVARLLQGDSSGASAVPAWGSAMTPGYASPELIRGDRLDVRSDIYSLGVVLHELLTGSRPQPVQHSRGHRSGLSGPLQEVLDKALASLPADRYSDATAFAVALRPFLRATGSRSLLAVGRYVVPAALLLASGAALLWNQREAASASTNTTAVSLAVLPFKNLGAPPQAYRAIGFAETLGEHLGRIAELQILGPQSTFAFNGSTAEAQEISGKLGVSYVLEGSFFGDGPNLRVSVVLTDGRDGSVLMDESYVRPVEKEIRGLLDEISDNVATSLALKLDVATLAQDEGGTTSLAAADRYWRWRQFVFQDYPREQNIDELVRALREAVALDPGFLRARDALASALGVQSSRIRGTANQLEQIALRVAAADAAFLKGEAARQRETSEMLLNEARAGRDRLQKLAPASWVALKDSAYKAALEERWEDAEKFGRMVLASHPRTPEKIKPLADVLFAMGRIDEAIRLEDEEARLAPFSTWISRNQQYNYFAAGRAAEAEAEYQRSRGLTGNMLDVRFLAFVRLLADPASDPAELRERYPGGPPPPDAPESRFRQELFAALGDRQRMREVLRRHFEGGNDISHVMVDALGDSQLAMQAFLRGWEENFRHKDLSRAYWNLWLMPNSGMRADPAFKKLVKDIGLADYWRRSNKWADFCQAVGEDDFRCS